MKLNNKVAIITGGGTGIGKATAELFAKEGAKVVVTGRRSGPLEEVVGMIKHFGGQALSIVQDVAQEAGWDSVIDKTIAQFGQVDILVNNAGIVLPGNAEETSLADFETVQSVNMTGVFLGTRAAIKAMKKNGGAIINVSSIEGITGEPNAAAYNASKGAVRIYSKSAALHCANNGYNIRVNTLHPGLIETPMTTTNIIEQMGEEAAMAVRASILAKVPMGRIAQPMEMATGILFLSCDDSSYMTGAELVLDGGYTAH